MNGHDGAGRIGRTRMAIGAVACALAASVLLAPAAVASTDPGGGGCPGGYLGTSANGTFAGAPVRPGTTDTNVAPRYNELVGTGCYRRTGGSAAVRFSWSGVGRILSGTFVYQLIDCTTGGTSQALTRRMGYPNGSPGTWGSASVTIPVNAAHRYRLRISGDGSYSRRTDVIGGAIGYFTLYRTPGAPVWRSETSCS